MTDYLFFIIVFLLAVFFLMVATKMRWISWRGGHGIANLTAFHDFQPKDKQSAIEIILEQKAHKKMEEQDNGQEK